MADAACFYCEVVIAQGDREIDHKLPRSRGGSELPDNLVISCSMCNKVKGCMTAEEFLSSGFPQNLRDGKVERVTKNRSKY